MKNIFTADRNKNTQHESYEFHFYQVVHTRPIAWEMPYQLALRNCSEEVKDRRLSTYVIWEKWYVQLNT